MPLIHTRILSWQAFTFGISGYLHCGYNFWHRDTVRGPVAGSLTEFSRDPDLLLKTRRRIGRCIAALE